MMGRSHERTFFQIIGLPPWSGIAYCTIDGRVPSATNTIFIVSAGQGFDSKGLLPISSGPITCVAAIGTVPLTADAIQSGKLP